MATKYQIRGYDETYECIYISPDFTEKREADAYYLLLLQRMWLRKKFMGTIFEYIQLTANIDDADDYWVIKYYNSKY